MKDLSKRFINLHGSYSPVQTIQQNLVSPGMGTGGYAGAGGAVSLLPDYSYYCYPGGQPTHTTMDVSVQDKSIELQGLVAAQGMLPGGQVAADPVQELHQGIIQFPCQNGSYQLIPVQSAPPPGNTVLPPTSPILNYTAALQPQQTKKPVVTSPMDQLTTSPDYLLSQVQLKEGLYPLAAAGIKSPVMTGGTGAVDLQELLAAPYIRMSPGIPGALVSPVQGTNLISLRARTSPASKPRSPLLEAFRNNRCPILSLPDISQHAVEFSKDQHGSRFIQQKLEHSTQQHIQSFWQEVEPNVVELMTDVFGNYVVQKLLDFGGQSIQHKLLDKVICELITLSKHQFGCRVVQKIIAIFPKNTAATISKNLQSNLLECMLDQHANHVIQKLVEKVDSTVLQIFINTCLDKIVEVSCDEYGCRIVQRFLENSTDLQRKQILGQVDPNIYHLIQEQYGNYIVQHILDHGTSTEIDNIIKSIGGHVVELAQHKYASNVLEKCIEKTRDIHRGAFVTELVKSRRVEEMIEGQYSNYVLQKMIDNAPVEALPALMEVLRQHKGSMEKHSYGKNIWARVEKFYSENPQKFAKF